jgi:Rod binding domain-containing protein
MALPPIDQSLLPADIRNGSQERKQTYTAALGFERMLVSELAKSMSKTTQDDSDGNGADAATSTYRDMLPNALADGIVAGGGLGLARQMVPVEEPKR